MTVRGEDSTMRGAAESEQDRPDAASAPADGREVIVSLRGVVKTFGEGETLVRALDGVDLDIHRGDFAVLAGPSGSGKTCLLQQIGCLDDLDGGEVIVEGRHTARMSRSERSALRRDRLGFVFQNYNLITVLTAFENAEYVMMLQGVPPEERRVRASSRCGMTSWRTRSTGRGARLSRRYRTSHNALSRFSVSSIGSASSSLPTRRPLTAVHRTSVHAVPSAALTMRSTACRSSGVAISRQGVPERTSRSISCWSRSAALGSASELRERPGRGLAIWMSSFIAAMADKVSRSGWHGPWAAVPLAFQMRFPPERRP